MTTNAAHAAKPEESPEKKSVRVWLVEDEEPAARLLKRMILKLRPDWQVEHVATSNEEAEAYFKEQPQQPDVLFLDVELSDGNSFEFIEKVKPESMIVFVTAYDEFALRAFSVNSIDYLLKPVSVERLRATIEKYERLSTAYIRDVSRLRNWKEVSENANGPEKRYRTRFLIEHGNQLETLHVEDIAYFFSENKICYAQTFNDGNFVLDASLDRLGEELNPDRFFRATRQVLVCPKAITKIENYFQGKVAIYTQPPYKEQILVSKEKAEAFRKWLKY
ncbi:MAG: LytTR family DNA-binding domain-containing protein [Bacteroidales bacterium]|nr:LytTR family DNA-binding domain-containing protein [Bacteroidales bacterium]MDE7091218.1 LytTR family DNA-binding domain-containing protein [Bacteroidales bacterium]MDE7102849.1 LytTR family DNA-binding domain-containing protein [Bacteroidales bacterium]